MAAITAGERVAGERGPQVSTGETHTEIVDGVDRVHATLWLACGQVARCFDFT